MNFSNFIKRHSVLIIAGGLSLCAIAIFALTILMSNNLKEKVQTESIRTGKRIRTLSSSVVSSGQAGVERQYQNAFKADAEAISSFGAQSTTRQLLSYDIFPKPNYSSQQFFDQFSENYRRNIKVLISRMDAKDCPSDEELYLLMPATRTATTDIRSVAERNIPSEASEEIEKIACDKRAEEIKTYANPVDMANYTGWGNWKYSNRSDAIDYCWRSQLAFWIQEDVVDTIVAMNDTSDNILTSPVKRLVGISFNKKDIDASSGRITKGPSRHNPAASTNTNTAINAGFDFPKYVTGTQASALNTKAWTMRKCNNDIDVVHFSMAVIVEHQKVLAFMKEFCSSKEHKFSGFSNDQQERTLQHNQITILESKVEAVVNSDQQHWRYRYGDNPVVKLNLVCEYIFRRAGYDQIKPESIKKELQPPETIGGAARPSNKRPNRPPNRRTKP